jgi:hypothetical protein
MKLTKLITMREALASDGYFGRLLAGDSWQAWRVLLIAILGEELTEDERTIFESLTGRPQEPAEPVEEFWAVIGRRGGKTRSMAVLAAYIAGCVDHRDILAPGERGVLPIMAASTVQATQAFNFVSGIFATALNLKGLLENETNDTLSLASGVDITIRPASFRTIRGITAVGAIGDEIAFWRSDDSANPDTEILRALRPALATTGGLLAAISSPHAKRGELYTTFKRHFGPTGHPSILVAKAPSRTMNPSLSQRVVDRAYEEDPEAASAEYGAEFRGDLAIFVSREVVDAAVANGVIVRPPIDGVTYFAFVDPSGGSSDSMTMAVAHNEKEGRVILDCIGERKAPFSPEAVVTEFAATLKSYRVSTVEGDRYAGEWPRERFKVHGIEYRVADMVRSELYLAFLPMLNSGRVDLLDNQRMVTQFVGLERRTSRAGKDTVDHAPGSHDDVANAVAGALVLAGKRVQRPVPIVMPFYTGRATTVPGGPTSGPIPESTHYNYGGIEGYYADRRSEGFSIKTRL